MNIMHLFIQMAKDIYIYVSVCVCVYLVYKGIGRNYSFYLVSHGAARVRLGGRLESKVGLLYRLDCTILVLISRSSRHPDGANHVVSKFQNNSSGKWSHLVPRYGHHGRHLTKLGRLLWLAGVPVSKGTGGILVDDATVRLGVRDIGNSHWGATVHALGYQS